jgi:hypothetical protein
MDEIIIIFVFIGIISFWFAVSKIESYLNTKFNSNLMSDFNIYDVNELELKIGR